VLPDQHIVIAGAIITISIASVTGESNQQLYWGLVVLFVLCYTSVQYEKRPIAQLPALHQHPRHTILAASTLVTLSNGAACTQDSYAAGLHNH
jgi:hypothetical protein